MKKDKYHLILIVSLIVLFSASNLLLLFLGESSQNIAINLLSGIAFVPIEVYATVFLLERFLNRRDKLLEEMREDSDYFSIAKEAQDQLIWSIKHGLLENFLGPVEDVHKDFEKLYQDRTQLLTPEFWEKGQLKEHLLLSTNIYMISEERIKSKDLTALELSTEVGEFITGEITEFYAIYLKFIPLDIFKELHEIYKALELSIIFSDNPYVFQTKQQLIEKQKKEVLDTNDYQELARISQQLIAFIYQHLTEIEHMTEDHFFNLEQID